MTNIYPHSYNPYHPMIVCHSKLKHQFALSAFMDFLTFVNRISRGNFLMRYCQKVSGIYLDII